MAQGDRVVVGDGYHWKESDGEKTMAYMPQLNESGGQVQTPDGGTIVANAGGVVCGSTGVIQGDVINVHRSYIHDTTNRSAAMGNDFAQLVPVFMDKYQRVGYFPVDNIRIFSGGQS